MRIFISIFSIVHAIFLLQSSAAQPGTWTWISGTNTIASSGIFGVQGVPSINNYPPGCYEPAEWKDKQGNFWVYGGLAPAYSDLWRYSILSNEWTWIKGNGLTAQPPVFGTQGIPDPGNTPGERKWASVTWVDTTGNLWLFGGNYSRNDLWKYDIATNQWTWISGSTFFNAAGVYGIQGVPGPLNVPGARMETSSGWTDTLNNLWLFGGYGIDSTGNAGYLNDLWKYNINTNEWTFMKGSPLAGTAVSYGIRGISDANNHPGGCHSYTKWKDEVDNFWIFGASNVSSNALWKYSPAVNEWTWMAGTTVPDDSGSYYNTCLFDSANLPRARWEHRSAAQDNCGRFWLFGGWGNPGKRFNDLWVFDPTILKFNWLHGNNIINDPGNYGLMGVSSTTNLPPSRMGGVSWWGSDNNFYLFGGCGAFVSADSNFNDLWRFTPDSNCIPICYGIPSAAFYSSGSLCPGSCTDFSNLSSNATNFKWNFPGGFPDTSSANNPLNICYSNTGSYDVILIAANASGSDTLTLANYITVYAAPSPQAISQSGDTLFANPGSTSYQWYFNTVLISGATDYFYVAQSSGDFNLVASDSNGCEVEAAIFNVVAIAPSLFSGSSFITVFPIPGYEKLLVSSSSNISQLRILNLLDEEIFKQNISNALVEIDISYLKRGIYFLHLRTEQGWAVKKFIKE